MTNNMSDVEIEALNTVFSEIKNESNSEIKSESEFSHDEAEAQSISLMLSKAVRHHRYGELSKAEVIYQEILQREPNHAIAMKKYGVLLFQLGDYSMAEQIFEQAYSIVIFDEQLSINLIMCKKKLNKLVDIVPIIRVILKHNPQSIAGKDLLEQFKVSKPNAEPVT